MSLLAASLAAISATCATAAILYKPLFAGSATTRRARELASMAPNAVSTETSETQRAALLAARLDQLARVERDRRRMPLKALIAQAGYTWTPRQVVLAGAAIGVGVAALSLSATTNPLIALPAAALTGYFAPALFLRRARAKRLDAFVRYLPDALSALASARRAGSDLASAIPIIVRDAQEPVRSEFGIVAEENALGASLPEALDRLAIRVPVEEARFLALAIAIQADEGGRLASTLASLADIIRQRSQLADKLRAMTAETRASASLLTALPIVVTLISYLRDPQTTALLWTTQAGTLALTGSIVWLAIGHILMKRLQRIDA
ncbi:type II secretion system F family protein [Xanthobacter sp. V13C-7B]|uniref:type II secretion system F family protein n=1 Tax=Xanthobacter variabilis TaxID=3119932 RepID=UPI00372AE9AA